MSQHDINPIMPQRPAHSLSCVQIVVLVPQPPIGWEQLITRCGVVKVEGLGIFTTHGMDVHMFGDTFKDVFFWLASGGQRQNILLVAWQNGASRSLPPLPLRTCTTSWLCVLG